MSIENDDNIQDLPDTDNDYYSQLANLHGANHPPPPSWQEILLEGHPKRVEVSRPKAAEIAAGGEQPGRGGGAARGGNNR